MDLPSGECGLVGGGNAEGLGGGRACEEAEDLGTISLQPLNGERVSLASGESADGQGVEEMGTSPKVRAVIPLGL